MYRRDIRGSGSCSGGGYLPLLHFFGEQVLVHLNALLIDIPFRSPTMGPTDDQPTTNTADIFL